MLCMVRLLEFIDVLQMMNYIIVITRKLFKDNYIGRIVIASGKIATDLKNNKDDKEWNIKYDKEEITIEDALPIVQLSRKRKISAHLVF